jgi:hypothetical protein
MKRSTIIILAVVLGGAFLVFALVSKPTIAPGVAQPATTLSSIFTFGTKLVDAGEKALPSFFNKDTTPDVTDTSLTAYASSSGFADHSDS